ncbi:hypothetical protein ACFPN2_06715 [Steroidobacter flavus]|uniref:Integrating conjugative element protein n=1 Tax=Steroidobacter flavus TaxID=1842136 RepID=A0ABV8SQP7_9GAMM
MKSVVIFSTLLLLPLSALSAEPPYKEVMNEAVRAKQPVVYARVADHGFGIQYRRDSGTGFGVGNLVGGILGGYNGAFIGGMSGVVADKIADTQPTELAEKDAEALSPFMDRAAAQHDLEVGLAESLATAPLFEMPAVLNALPPGASTGIESFKEDPVLIVELYASLLTDYTGLQVTLLAQELSPSAVDSPTSGRVYRNRIDYVSPLLTPTHIKDRAEIKADVDAVKAKYKGRKLNAEEQKQMNEELKDAKAGTTLEKYRLPLMEQWTANDGVKLREELQIGTRIVTQLLARDLMDYSAVEIRREIGSKDWGTARDSTMDRQVRVFFGGPFAGSLVSQPTGYGVRGCQGIGFKKTVPPADIPKLCIIFR